MAKPTLNSVALDGISDRLRHDESDTRAITGRSNMDDQGGSSGSCAGTDRTTKIVGRPQPGITWQQQSEASGRQRDPALATPVRNDGTASARAHAGAETMVAAAPTVARLERTLAHNNSGIGRTLRPLWTQGTSRIRHPARERRTRRLVNDTRLSTVRANDRQDADKHPIPCQAAMPIQTRVFAFQGCVRHAPIVTVCVLQRVEARHRRAPIPMWITCG